MTTSPHPTRSQSWVLTKPGVGGRQPPSVSLVRPGHEGSDQQPPQGSYSHSGEPPPGPCSLRAGVALTLELIRHHLFGLLCPLGQQGEQSCPGGSVEPPQCLWSRPHEWSEVRGRPSGQRIHRFHGNAPSIPAPSGPSAPRGQTGSPREPALPGLLDRVALPPPPG